MTLKKKILRLLEKARCMDRDLQKDRFTIPVSWKIFQQMEQLNKEAREKYFNERYESH